MDWIELGTGLLGALAAVVALVVARRSAADARASAQASEASAEASRTVAALSAQELELARREAEAAERERERRPELVLHLAAVAHSLHPGDPMAILTVTMGNSGSRPAVDAQLRIGASGGTATIDSVLGPDGADPRRLPEHRGHAVRGDGGPVVPWSFVTESHTLPVGAVIPRHFRVQAPQGFLDLTVRLFHADARESEVTRRARLNLAFDPNGPVLDQAR